MASPSGTGTVVNTVSATTTGTGTGTGSATVPAAVTALVPILQSLISTIETAVIPTVPTMTKRGAQTAAILQAKVNAAKAMISATVATDIADAIRILRGINGSF